MLSCKPDIFTGERNSLHNSLPEGREFVKGIPLKLQNIDKELHEIPETDIFTEKSMNQLSIRKALETPYLSEQRKSQRYEIINLLAITERGTGQVLDINSEGLSFGCLYPHTFPNEFYLDILDAKGSHIQKLKVRKTHETGGDSLDSSAQFELVIGVEFYQLTESQSDELDFLLDNNMESIGFSYLEMI
jgi:hypothetical protein